MSVILALQRWSGQWEVQYHSQLEASLDYMRLEKRLASCGQASLPGLGTDWLYDLMFGKTLCHLPILTTLYLVHWPGWLFGKHL